MSKETNSSTVDVKCVLGEPTMHGPKPYRWCATHNRLMAACEAGQCVLCGDNAGVGKFGVCKTLDCFCHCVFPSVEKETAARRSNHFSDGVLDKGFPDHISKDGKAWYADGSVVDAPAPSTPVAVEPEPRHPFQQYKKTDYCGATLATYARCGHRENHPVHLSDDVVDDRHVPFESAVEPERPAVESPERIWLSVLNEDGYVEREWLRAPVEGCAFATFVEYVRVQPTPTTVELPCAGLEGCHSLEGVMYDFFVHDPACPKSPEQRRIIEERERAVKEQSVEAALTELREMFPNRCNSIKFHTCVEETCAADYCEVNGERRLTLAEAMAKVRAAKESGKK